MRFTVYDVTDAAAVYGAQARADKLDLAVLELANEGYRPLKGGVVSAQGSPNMTVAISAGCDLNNGREVWYGAQSSGAITAPTAGNDKWILVEVDASGVLQVSVTATGPTTGTTARPVPTAGRVVHALIYISASTITDIDGTNTAGHGKIQDQSVLTPAQPRGSESFQRWCEIFDDFFGANTADGAIGQLGWHSIVSGTGASTSGPSIGETEPGACTLAMGTTTTGLAIINLGTSQTQVGLDDLVFEWRVRIPQLSTSAQEFEVLVGVHQNVTDGTTDPVTGFWFKYDRLNTGANWQIVNGNGTTRTTHDSGIAVDNTAYHRLKVVYSQSLGTVHFYIDDVECTNSPHTTNLPAGAVFASPSLNVQKKAGTTARSVWADYFYMMIARSRT